MKQDRLLSKGLKVRREVLGDEHVAKSFQSGNRYTLPMAEFTTRVAWGMVWSRPGLARKERSLLNLGALIAMGQMDELRLHIRSGLRNGLTRKQIAEAILHCAVYCGIPRAAAARRAMCEVFEQLETEEKNACLASTKKRR